MLLPPVSRALIVAVIALVATGCATIRAAGTRSTEQLLAAAGFHMELADRPETAARLETLPPRKMAIERHGAELLYVYPDPDVCACAYVGSESQYQEYQRLALRKTLADEQLRAATIWGPWGAPPWGRWGAWAW